MLLLTACASAPSGRTTGPVTAPARQAPDAASAHLRVLMIDSATAMLGQPYRWGGAAPGGFDCSGLVVYAAAGAGLRVPRTTAEQISFGVPITRGDIRAGDLVFMHLSHKNLHVGIALNNERFVHAPSSGAHVRIDSLDAQPYAGAFLGARRIIPRPALPGRARLPTVTGN